VEKPRRGVARETVRETVREPKLQRGEVIGRDGEVLRRNRQFEDQYKIPEHIKEKGWSYQWNRHSVYGKEDVADMAAMMDNGWRPVPPSRLGLGSETGDCVIRGGLILMERPQSLTDEATAEDNKRAATQYVRSFQQTDTDVRLPDGMKDVYFQMRREKRERVDPSLQPNVKTRTVENYED
jgi:hypothetical protein